MVVKAKGRILEQYRRTVLNRPVMTPHKLLFYRFFRKVIQIVS